MARAERRAPGNVPGDFYVDDSCIDCETCRWMAPETFSWSSGQSVVHAQPDPAQRRRALMALVACPTASIGTEQSHPMGPVKDAFPDPIEGGVYHAGYHAESSFGAASYLITRPGGNVLVDSPRFARPLVRRIEALGGVSLIFLTHRDDVADQRKWKEHFGAARVMHADDLSHGTRDVEHVLTGREPTRFDAELSFIPVPGHTKGSTCLLYRERILFSGDHLAWDLEQRRLYAFKKACWYSWEEQARSMRRLLAVRFERVLPGHGAPAHLPPEEMHASLAACVAWMER